MVAKSMCYSKGRNPTLPVRPSNRYAGKAAYLLKQDHGN